MRPQCSVPFKGLLQFLDASGPGFLGSFHTGSIAHRQHRVVISNCVLKVVNICILLRSSSSLRFLRGAIQRLWMWCWSGGENNSVQPVNGLINAPTQNLRSYEGFLWFVFCGGFLPVNPLAAETRVPGEVAAHQQGKCGEQTGRVYKIILAQTHA